MGKDTGSTWNRGEMKRKYMEAWGSAKEVPGRMGKLKVGRGPGYACTLSSL